MKVVVVYRRESETGRAVEEFLHDFRRLHPQAVIEVTDLDSREGSLVMKTYDLMTPPVILALREDGSPLNIWQGDTLPLMDEVASYLQM